MNQYLLDQIEENIAYWMCDVPDWIGDKSGWGYTKDDAMIMACKDSQTGVHNEYLFAEYRSRIEVREILEMVYVGFERRMQGFVQEDGCNYDVLQFNVCFLTNEDWLFLKNDYESHNNYAGDEVGLKKHHELRNQRIKYYTSECWINIDSFYGKKC